MGMTPHFAGHPVPRTSGQMLATSMFVHNHGRGLSDLVDIVDDDGAINAVCDLVANHVQVAPCPDRSRKAIEVILDTLERVMESEAERLARHWNIDIGSATRWYGARLTDLHGRFGTSA